MSVTGGYPSQSNMSATGNCIQGVPIRLKVVEERDRSRRQKGEPRQDDRGGQEHQRSGSQQTRVSVRLGRFSSIASFPVLT